ncbi:LysR substrate-binding domain-containing protein [Brevibacterium luteolum]|uniref:LysR substrate-binding domain-containing protein n=1 Tax=Brevibacterium luteolum TaxID=199591 RepID=UPI00223ABE1A|nr:LysR substrate-binding domain-containing protein [Brevibacterium luteolum]MCT1829764.1 LysR substrate-binding domain-containing protein [Brevibacterium luteolum]MCT1874059.1 LysR substrate-binding domain-containing protein [Brevibacterium luteolum]MCT1891365.1 LysR substrate-binding domain-containing protein [Brevibacterium luteolum]MCT1893285.1 LysR substrate-binding domain-containing protein [Brevibacterium luteolum]MCT1923965.1 LysR substrate-binding domain-containing protein [Brevibacte
MTSPDDAHPPAGRLPDPQVLALLVELDRHTTSIGQAARALDLAQPNASRMLRTFERESGIPLLNRSPRGTKLTPQGQALAAWAAEIMTGYDHLLSGMAALRREVGARVRVSASMTIAEHLLPQWLERFRTNHPNADVGMSICNTTAVCANVREGSCDIGLIESTRVPDDLTAHPIGTDTLVIVAAPTVAAQFAAPEAVDAAQLAARPLVVREEGSGTREVIEAALRSAGGVQVAAAFPSNAAVKVAALAGLAPAAISRLAVESELRTGSLVEVPVTDEVRLSRPLHALWAKGPRLRGAAADFLALISAE